jgi:hypothetical protein
MVFVNVYTHFRIWTRIRFRNPWVTDPDASKVTDPCGSGSTTLGHSVIDLHYYRYIDHRSWFYYFLSALQANRVSSLAVAEAGHSVIDLHYYCFEHLSVMILFYYFFSATQTNRVSSQAVAEAGHSVIDLLSALLGNWTFISQDFINSFCSAGQSGFE